MKMSLSKRREIVKDREAWMLQSIGLQIRTWLSDWATNFVLFIIGVESVYNVVFISAAQ